jgi:hypothetical protein
MTNPSRSEPNSKSIRVEDSKGQLAKVQLACLLQYHRRRRGSAELVSTLVALTIGLAIEQVWANVISLDTVG